MPKLEDTIHLDMLRQGKKRRSLQRRFKEALKVFFQKDDLYGHEWGDPGNTPMLGYVRDHFLKPYSAPNATILEIGPGGGRWTRYMKGFKVLYAVDYHQELLDEFTRNFSAENIVTVKNNGDDFPGVPDHSIDFLFSFGVFVHLDLDIIDRYLVNIKRILKSGSEVVIQYSDKTKPLAAMKKGFSDNNPEKMRSMVVSHGYEIREEDTKTLPHSSIIRFGLPQQ